MGKKTGRPRGRPKTIKGAKLTKTGRVNLEDPAVLKAFEPYLGATETIRIEIPYVSRPVQETIQNELRTHRFCVLVTHRQMGKTICVINHIIREALKTTYPNARYFYVAPFLKQAKLIAWDHFKYYLKEIPNMKINETELTIVLPNGSKIYLVGADNPDAMRGSYANGVVLDEYAMGKDIFEEIIRPMFTNTNGWCVFTSTPKGQNHFYKLWLKSQSGLKDWWGGMFTARDSGVIKPEDLKDIESQSSSESMFRQEYMCDFMASSDNVLIRIDDVYVAQRRQYRLDEIEHSATIIGVDCARYGDDRTVITVRKGLQMFPQRYFQGLNTAEITERIIDAINDYGYDGICIDQAFGGGVIDRLREFGYDNVFEVNFNMKSADEHCKNKRAEMWWKMGEWIRKEGAMPQNEDLTQELTNVLYGFSSGAGQIQLEGKELVKKRIGKSPDLADSLALTFAFPIQKRGLDDRKSEYAVSDYQYI